MRLPVPDPRELISLVPRLLDLVDRVELLVDRIGGVADAAGALVLRTELVVTGAEAEVARLSRLVDDLEPSLTRLQPVLDRLAETTDPREVEGLVALVNHLPALSEQVERDVLPVLTTLGTVAPDIHDLLAVSRELNDMLAKVPGLGRIKRRIDEEQGEDRTTARVVDD